MLDVPRLPLADIINTSVKWMRSEFRPFFRAISDRIEGLVDIVELGLNLPVPIVFGVFLLLALLAGGWRLALLSGAGLGLILNLGLWGATMETTALVLSAGLVCLALGIPLGVASARWAKLDRVVRPTLDFMQTMPAFVYLIPAITFFRIGVVSALLATVVFALPPIVRLVAHGIRHVDAEVVEASEAFGATPWQTLVKVQLPLARPSILVGVNQTLMMSLSMVVIASMVGAGGLGGIVYEGISTLDAGLGFEGGVAIVILAVVLDRITQGLGATPSQRRERGLFDGLRAALARPWRALALGLRDRDPLPARDAGDGAPVER